MNYISWLESLTEGDNTEKLRSAFKRACTSHLPNKVGGPGVFSEQTSSHPPTPREGHAYSAWRDSIKNSTKKQAEKKKEKCDIKQN
jgi:hypothetical protein